MKKTIKKMIDSGIPSMVNIVLNSMPSHLRGSGGIDARRLAGDQADRNNKNGWNQAGTNYGAISCLR